MSGLPEMFLARRRPAWAVMSVNRAGTCEPAPDRRGVFGRTADRVYDWVVGLLPNHRRYSPYREGDSAEDLKVLLHSRCTLLRCIETLAQLLQLGDDGALLVSFGDGNLERQELLGFRNPPSLTATSDWRSSLCFESRSSSSPVSASQRRPARTNHARQRSSASTPAGCEPRTRKASRRASSTI